MENQVTQTQEPVHTEEKAPQKQKKSDIVWIFDILGTFVALIAAVISLVTLFEMKIQRNNAYMPTIVFETAQVNTDLRNNEHEGIYESISFVTRNIGVGVAKKISFTLDSSNLIRWIELYNTMNPENPYPYQIKNGVMQVTIDGKKIAFEADHKTEKLFLLPNAEESYEFALPSPYTILLYEIYKHANTGAIAFPELEVDVTYYDVQNVQYKETLHLCVKTLFFINSENQQGVTFQIYMK